MRRLPGPKNPAEMTYYAQLNGAPITGTTAAKTLSSLDSQTMALTLGYFVQVQAEREFVSYCTSVMLCITSSYMCEGPSKSGSRHMMLSFTPMSMFMTKDGF